MVQRIQRERVALPVSRQAALPCCCGSSRGPSTATALFSATPPLPPSTLLVTVLPARPLGVPPSMLPSMLLLPSRLLPRRLLLLLLAMTSLLLLRSRTAAEAAAMSCCCCAASSAAGARTRGRDVGGWQVPSAAACGCQRHSAPTMVHRRSAL